MVLKLGKARKAPKPSKLPKFCHCSSKNFKFITNITNMIRERKIVELEVFREKLDQETTKMVLAGNVAYMSCGSRIK
jgi:hypothetical protein